MFEGEGGIRLKVPFSRPDISDAEIKRVNDVLKSGWITTGPAVREFEQESRKMTGSSGCAAFSSATAALEAILRFLGIGEGDEVILPAYTFTATASPVIHVGAKPVLADCASGSYEIDYERLPELVTDRTKAVIAVDLGGIIADYDSIYRAAENGQNRFSPSNDRQTELGRIAVIADAAHSFGSSRRGIPAGSWADFSSFSFHAVKNVTCAEGGAAVWKGMEYTDNDEIYSFFRTYALHGQTRDAFSRGDGKSWKYDIDYPAYKCNMTDISAAVGLAQIERFPEMTAKRKRLIEKYNAAFSGTGLILLEHYSEDNDSNGHLYLVRIPGITEEQRDEVISEMRDRGIACNVHYRPLPMLKAYRDLGYEISDFPHAYDQYRNTISLPLFSVMSDKECQYVVDSFLDILCRRGVL